MRVSLRVRAVYILLAGNFAIGSADLEATQRPIAVQRHAQMGCSLNDLAPLTGDSSGLFGNVQKPRVSPVFTVPFGSDTSVR
jgi:hypothetical protein